MKQGKYPNTFYRVSVKAVIKNDTGDVLAVKEHSDSWELPGGGIDHNETIHECLTRELSEELGIENDFTETFLKIETCYVEFLEIWKMILVYDVKLIGDFSLNTKGDINDAKFIPVDIYNKNKRDIEPKI